MPGLDKMGLDNKLNAVETSCEITSNLQSRWWPIMYQHLGKVSFHGSVLEVIFFFILICILTCYFSRIDSRGDGSLGGVRFYRTCVGMPRMCMSAVLCHR